jgi:hypothetical protein
MACISLHGTFHELDEPMEGHYNCRCACMPAVRFLGNPIEVSGVEWFEGLSAAKQKEMMGPEFYDAWKGGAFEISDMWHKVEDPVYGEMTTERPLWDLLGGEPPMNTGSETEP